MKLFYKISVLIFFLALWFFINQNHLIKPIFLPKITAVFSSLQEIIFSEYGLKNIFSTLGRVLIGFFIALSFSVPLGIFLGVFKKIYESLEWFIDFFRSIPVTAMFPLFLIFFGFGDASKIAMGAWACGFIILVNTISGVWNSKPNREIMAKTKKASYFQILTKITFFEALPFIFTGIKIGVSWNLIVVIVAEMFIGTRYGLGRLIYDSSITLDTPMVFSGIIIIGLIGYFLNQFILILERKIIHWQ
ncbi:MAG TPA: ABC transporter permease [Candidatus Moranbacteria bacterium]|nr:ABC transporter permease [Candidatus Moranbacteria bacterium]